MAIPVLLSTDAALGWLRSRGVRALVADSRRVGAGDAFLAWPGQRHDARSHVRDALRQGATAVLVEAQGADAFEMPAGAPVAGLLNLKAAAGVLAHALLHRPSEFLRVFAVTGTNGKTSVSWWLAQALGLLGPRCGVIGTLGAGQPPDHLTSTGLTTPDAIRLHETLADFVRQGFACCTMEASSIGLAEHRLAGLRIDTALFTNLTQDHLDYHGTMQAYWQAKQRLFEWPGLRAAVIHTGDAHGAELAERLAHQRPELERWTVALDRDAHLRGEMIGYGRLGGLHLRLHEDGAAVDVHSALVGDFNAQNLLVAAAGLRAAGHRLTDVAVALQRLQPVPGRLQRVPGGPNEALAVVDYAHTPDALDKVLQALRPLATQRQGRLWCVFGCGGNRDPGKRPRMAAVAEALADRVVLTSDNPRDESPRMILAQMATGLVDPDHVAVIEDRREAIRHAIDRADPADLILVAGKGHEAEQEIAGLKHPFSDLDEVQAALALRRQRLRLDTLATPDAPPAPDQPGVAA
jgi:UDP-N-acetylmuramyl-tripeptide synthetase